MSSCMHRRVLLLLHGIGLNFCTGLSKLANTLVESISNTMKKAAVILLLFIIVNVPCDF